LTGLLFRTIDDEKVFSPQQTSALPTDAMGRSVPRSRVGGGTPSVAAGQPVFGVPRGLRLDRGSGRRGIEPVEFRSRPRPSLLCAFHRPARLNAASLGRGDRRRGRGRVPPRLVEARRELVDPSASVGEMILGCRHCDVMLRKPTSCLRRIVLRDGERLPRGADGVAGRVCGGTPGVRRPWPVGRPLSSSAWWPVGRGFGW
jgi:hypothetical protein